MVCLCVVLYFIVSYINLININRLISIIANLPGKHKFSVPTALYLSFASIYMFFHTSKDYPLLDAILLITSYLLLLISLQKNNLTLKKIRLIYISILYLTMDSILHSIVTFILSIFNLYYTNSEFKLCISLLTGFIFFIGLLVIKKSNYKLVTFNIECIPPHIYGLILLALFFSGGLIENQLFITDEIEFQNRFTRNFIIVTILLLIFIIASLIFNCISKAYFENVSSILEKQVNAQVDYYKKVDKLNKDLRDFRHDYKNHMICVQGLLDAHQYDEAREYVHGITL